MKLKAKHHIFACLLDLSFQGKSFKEIKIHIWLNKIHKKPGLYLGFISKTSDLQYSALLGHKQTVPLFCI